MTNNRKEIHSLRYKEIEDYLVSKGEKKFRVKQVYEWLWSKNASSFSEMKNISKKVIGFLSEDFEFHNIKVKNSQISSDKTIKLVFELFDGEVVEGVLIPTSSRATACISTQVGCALACEFCATGKMGFSRNLTTWEIYQQAFIIKEKAQELYDLNLSNIVIMGMGEPLNNYDNVLGATKMFSSEKGLAMSPSRITLSTAGLSKMIKQLGDDNVKFNLSISLHVVNNMKRNKLMPVNVSNPVESLIESIQYFYDKTKTRVTFEYLMLNNINDSITDAKDLAEFCKNFPCKINIIEYNETDGEYQQSDELKMNKFVDFLTNKNLIVNVRRSRGQDIAAACGQLANKEN